MSENRNILITAVALAAVSGMYSQTATIPSSVNVNHGFPFVWLKAITISTITPITYYSLDYAGFLLNLAAYMLLIYAWNFLRCNFQNNGYDRWDILLLALVMLAVFLKVNEPVMKGNILHDRPLLDGVLNFNARESCEDTANLVENTSPEKQKMIGLLDTAGLFSDWVIGGLVAGVMYIIVRKADWKILCK